MKNWFLALLAAGTVAVSSPPPAPHQPPVTCLKNCSISERGLSLVRNFEGYMPFPYKDVAGIETVGYGHVILPGERLQYPLLPPAADALLKKNMASFERAVNQAVNVPLVVNQFDALTSFSYNVGSGALRGSTLLRRVNAAQHTEVPSCFLMWDKATIDGIRKSVKGLTVRRQAEANLYAGI